MTALRIAKYVVLTTLVVTIALFLHYNLPRTDVVQISGTDVKRTDNRGKDEGVTRDVRFITALTRDDKTRVYRNEDTGWGWPPYLKFNSADLSGQAQMFAGEAEKSWVAVTYYGWRVTVLSLFPNAITLEKVDKDYSNLPLFNIFFLLALAVGIFFIVRGVRKIQSSLRAARVTETSEPTEE